MDGNGWMDIGYSLVVCAHRKVFVGRGPHVLPSANGAGLNSGHYAVLGLVGTSGVVNPPDAMLHGIRDAIEYLRANGGAGVEIKGHRDGYATSCPGGPLYAWVQKGAPRPATTTPPDPKPTPTPDTPKNEEEPMPEVVSVGLSADVTVPPDQNYQPWWTKDFRDTAKWHPKDGQSIAPTVDVWADVNAYVALSGLEPGEVVQVGLTRHLADGSMVDVAYPIGELMPVRADADGRVNVGLNGHFKLSKEQRGRVTIQHTSGNRVTLGTASCLKAILFRY
ncbi:peptidoglycan recognition protein family protein [Microtetraspora malaysiensis]|uniref:peptidoglycan recognition protein family protein n=1 Tax=Microtetraspora malaysiensis TaxID=161358 RepID=UPI003D908205